MKRPRQRRDLLAIPWVIAALFVSGAHGQCEVAQLQSGKGGGNVFGRSVSTDGEIVVVGDPLAFGALGAAFVYRQGPGGYQDWRLEGALTAPEPALEDSFGFRVAVSGTVIVIGAAGAEAPDFQSGAAYTFRYDGSQWNYETTLTPSDGDIGDLFGWSVAIDGDVAVIGARDDENDAVGHSGSAYVFRYDGSDWVEEAKLTDPNGEEFDLFGVSVSVRGDVALIGAHGNLGAAFVFRYYPDPSDKWLFETEIPSDGVGQDWFGFSVSLADGVAIVGAFQDNSTDKGNDAGSASIFRYDGDGWIEEQNLIASDASPLDWFGGTVAISTDGNTALIGAPLDDDLGSESGSVYVFRHTQGVWKELQKLTASDGAPFHWFGGSVTVSEDIGMIGAPAASQVPGAVYVVAGLFGIDCNDNGEPDACDIFNGKSSDENNNGIPDECDSIPGDIDGDGTVGVNDLLILLSSWGPCGDCDDCSADLNGDCVIGVSDLLILLANWG